MKVFITGISGLLGLNLALQTRRRFQISGCYHAHPAILTGIQTLKLDLTSLSNLEQALLEIAPDVVIHTAGLTNVEECEARPQLAYRLNVEATRNVAKVTKTIEAKLVHISTDHLLDGGTAWKTEEAIPTTLNTYAETKWRAEQAVLEECPDGLIMRTNFFGWGTSVRLSFTDWILRALHKEQELTMFSDVFFTPILINDLVEAMIELITRGATGIFHVAGSERLSKYAFALHVAQIFGFPRQRIREISVDDFPFRAKRPKDMSLSSEKAVRFLGRHLPGIRQGLYRLRELEAQGYRASLERAATREVSSKTEGSW